MMNEGVGLALIAVTSLCNVLMIGIGFLSRPSRAGGFWALGMTVSMIASYAWVTGEAIDSATLRGASSGLMISSMGVLWLGFRIYRRVRTFWWLVAAFVIASPMLLWLAPDPRWFLLLFSLVFAGGAAFAGFILRELILLVPVVRDAVYPLAAASVLYVMLSVLALINGIVAPLDGRVEAVSNAGEINAIGAIIYLVCSVVTLLLIVRHPNAARVSRDHGTFRSVATSRLTRAAAADDTWWSVLDVRLDDPEDLREASSAADFVAMTERFARDVETSFPADADIEAMTATHYVVLLPRTETAVRPLVATLLERVASTDDRRRSAFRLSASVGWAPVSAVGYDLDALMAAAAEASARAQRAGGDAFERAESAAVAPESAPDA